MQTYRTRPDVGYLGILVQNYGGRRLDDNANAAIQRDFDESTATIMCVQEAYTEFTRNCSWICHADRSSGLVTCARATRVADLRCVGHIHHLDGTQRRRGRTRNCYTGVQFMRITLIRPLGCLGQTPFFIVNCHFHRCTAKKQGGGGLPASYEWFFDYVVECYRECPDNSPCFLVGDFNEAAYGETIPNAFGMSQCRRHFARPAR